MKTGKKTALFFTAAILGILAALAVTCSFSVTRVQGASMAPSIEKGDRVLISRLFYYFRQPKAGDVVAFPCNVYSEDGEGSTLIKRVIATEGDQVEIRDGVLYVNGNRDDAYAASPVYLEAMDPITIGRDKIFVLSDSRSYALDSRDQAVGLLDTSEIIGKVCFK